MYMCDAVWQSVTGCHFLDSLLPESAIWHRHLLQLDPNSGILNMLTAWSPVNAWPRPQASR